MNVVMEPTKDTIESWFKTLQNDICNDLEIADGKGKFERDVWQRPGGGGGISRVINNGNVIEKGGVNFSAVWGDAPPHVLKSLELSESNAQFFATGVSIVLHPHNPFVPIIHMNVRYFEIRPDKENTLPTHWWFGGGIDLTPHYVHDDDARFFHQQLKDTCNKHHVDFYTKFKPWADDYFYLKHRKETRGVGGIFFDYLKDTDGFTKQNRFAFVQDVGKTFAPVYTALMQRNKEKPFTEDNKNWQMLRRGRYVEFNLVWDRGTKFGLETDGRTESILMSLPPIAHWQYNHQPLPDSAEAKTLQKLCKGINWV
jgi:coproporphyrinogen III oxidase